MKVYGHPPDSLIGACRCYEDPHSSRLAREELGMDSRYAEVALLTCPDCGQHWLRVFHELEAFTASGRWRLGAITPGQAAALTAGGAEEILNGLSWYFYGGSYYESARDNRENKEE